MFRRLVAAVVTGVATLCGMACPTASAATLDVVPYANSLANPYGCVGRISGFSGRSAYTGSGTAISSKGVVTCAHVLYDKKHGWGTDILFEYCLYGSSLISSSSPVELYIFGGYRQRVEKFGGSSRQAFARDFGGMSFTSISGVTTTPAWVDDGYPLLDGTNLKMIIGYGGEVHDGATPLKSQSTYSFYPIQGSYVYNDDLKIGAGMSGGPVFVYSGGRWVLSGVAISGPYSGLGAGVRALSEGTADLINQYLLN